MTTNFTLKKRNDVAYLTDGNLSWPKFRGAETRKKGDAITIELPQTAVISQVIVNSKGMNDNYSRNIQIDFSMDGKNWITLLQNPATSDVEVSETLGRAAKYVRISNQIDSAGQPWRISELDLIGSYL
ncbi:discoidin domain-containing protein [Paraglaciecola aquimarina]|uniref:Discoidin domain-containing protein n=1 Tax=Paraglaciecola aquimarina TaxID=1235557 RepID=A0ABU3SZ98_9ALTE|nr:discoidin domain-containing protein [Paraglaciecola aquimarina]MDU0355339.1 discoidin domain-containing protein [Paraglaciecola aquimarina]